MFIDRNYYAQKQRQATIMLAEYIVIFLCPSITDHDTSFQAKEVRIEREAKMMHLNREEK